ncbi:hypothetical protein FQR65_LT01679 [Abscondita terminalis]|nr:hypothetical protein FQR65_LT01679 [Abscondita terminalis]
MLITLLALFMMITTTFGSYGRYKVPEPQILVYYPTGLTVNIPHVPGMRLFAFHANFNKRINLGSSGEYYKQVVRETEDKWGFSDDSLSLNVGDIICYWITVVKDSASYKFIGNFTVTELLMLNVKTQTEDCSYNITRLQSEIEMLLKKNLLLTHLLEKTPNVKQLTMSGRVPLDGQAMSIVKFIIKEKLDITPTITRAVRNDDGSIIFEVATLDEKLHILNAAQTKLDKSKIFIS